MASLKEKVRQNWLASMGWYAPNAGQTFIPGPKASAEINAQKPNKKRRKPLVQKKREPRFKSF